jgi:chromosome segregation ATPase
MTTQLVHIQVNEPCLDKALKQIERRHDQHEEMNLELQRFLHDTPDRSELKAHADTLQQVIEDKYSKLNAKLTTNDSQLHSGLKDVETRLTTRFSTQVQTRTTNREDKIAAVERLIPQRDGRVDFLIERLEQIESDSATAAKQHHMTRECVRQTASALASLTDAPAVLDVTLPLPLRGSMNYITDNIKTLYEELQSLKAREGLVQSGVVLPEASSPSGFGLPESGHAADSRFGPDSAAAHGLVKN